MLKSILAPFAFFTATLIGSPVFIGSSSGGSGKSQGIYFADFDEMTGKLTNPILAAEYHNATFLAVHPTKQILYAVGQPKKPQADGSHSVAAFAISGGSLKMLGEVSSGGKGPCHIAVDATGRTIAVANYADGKTSTIRLNEEGVPVGPVTVAANKGAGPNKPRQDGPHAHGVYFNQANTQLFVPDLGLDKVFIYPFNAATSELGAPLTPILGAPGAGPRHLAFSPDEKFGYVINELNATLMAFSNDGTKQTVMGAVQTLPADFTGKNTAAEVELDAKGHFIYISNRGHDTIAVYKRDPGTGLVSFLQHAPCGGKAPRFFKIDPSGKWLICAHQDSNTISMLAIDHAAGTLSAPSNTISSPNPTCVLFTR